MQKKGAGVMFDRIRMLGESFGLCWRSTETGLIDSEHRWTRWEAKKSGKSEHAHPPPQESERKKREKEY